jgi:hypothetical protein
MNVNELKEPWGEYISEEHKELKEKYSKLVDYINSDKFFSLSPNSKKIITNQKVLMESYINNLSILLYENVDTVFIQDYSMLGLLFSTFTGGFGGSTFGPSSIGNIEPDKLSSKD